MGLSSEEQIRNAYGRILKNANKYRHGARIQGVLVQELVDDGLECMVWDQKRSDIWSHSR